MADEKKKERKDKKEKPLEKWTVKELREEVLKIGKFTGVHGMNKGELTEILGKERGIEPPKKKKEVGNIREMKSRIREMKNQRDEERKEGASRARLNILRKKVSRMKKLTRR